MYIILLYSIFEKTPTYKIRSAPPFATDHAFGSGVASRHPHTYFRLAVSLTIGYYSSLETGLCHRVFHKLVFDCLPGLDGQGVGVEK